MPGGHGLLPDGPRSNLHVLLAQGLNDVAGRDVPAREPARVEPDAHAVLAEPEEVDVADALEAPERVAHPDEREVADVELVVALGGREEVHHHQEVGGRLERRHADPPDVLRQAGLGDRDAVLDQHLRLVEVGAEPERDGERHLAVGRALRRHVEHVLDAVDLLLDRRRDRVRDDLGRRPGVRGLHHDRRRHDLGVLRDRQRPVGQATQDERDDREDGSEDRPVDEEA